jgi:hypothetical protein
MQPHAGHLIKSACGFILVLPVKKISFGFKQLDRAVKTKALVGELALLNRTYARTYAGEIAFGVVSCALQACSPSLVRGDEPKQGIEEIYGNGG